MGGNELDLVGGEMHASTVSEALTGPLEEALLKAKDTPEACRKVAKDPVLLAHARSALSTVSRLIQGLTYNELYIAIQPLVLMYGVPDFGQDTEAETLQRAWFDLYYGALKQHPKESIDIAVGEVLRLHKYSKFPLPADINSHAEPITAELKLIGFRLRKAVERADQHRPAKVKDPAERAAVTAMISDLRGAGGRIQLGRAPDAEPKPATDRRATADALRRLAKYK